MANITVHEFFDGPDEFGELTWPGNVRSTVATAGTVTLRDETKIVILTTDADGRVSFDGASAVASGMNILSSVPNYFKLKTGSARTLKFA